MSDSTEKATAATGHGRIDESEDNFQVHALSNVPSQDLANSAEQIGQDSIHCPNGGFTAWFRVFAAWLLFLIAWGPALTFGSFSAYYSEVLFPSRATTDIAWIGSLSTLLLVTTGVISGPLFDRGYVKHLLTLGIILAVAGYIATSFCTEFYQFVLAQGLCAGLGSGLIYVPALAFVNTSFSTKRPVAVGITTTGGSVGGIIFPILFRRLQPQIGFGWTVRTISFVQLGLAIIAMAILSPAPVKRNKPRNLIDFTALKELPFIFLCLMYFCQFLSYWVPLFFIPMYAKNALGASPDLASYLLVIANAASVFGRVIPAFIAQRWGPMNVVFGSTLIVAIITFCWIAVDGIAGFIVWCCVWGFTAGVFVAVDPVIVTHVLMAPSLSVFGTRLGMAWVAAGVGVLIGNPIAGTLADSTSKSYLNAQIFAGVIMFVGWMVSIVPFWAIWRHDRNKAKEKAGVPSA